MPKTKTTVYLDEDVLRGAKVMAARTGKKDYEVVEEALRAYLGMEVLDRAWNAADRVVAGDSAEPPATARMMTRRFCFTHTTRAPTGMFFCTVAGVNGIGSASPSRRTRSGDDWVTVPQTTACGIPRIVDHSLSN